MRIVIDMQGAQTESRFRGIGRYTLSFAQAIVHNRGEHELFLALSGLFPETIEPIRAAFDGLLPQENIRVWYAPGPVAEEHSDNDARREVAELIREDFLASLQPDIIHISSLFEGYIDDAVISIGRLDQITQVSVTVHDLIPLINQAIYLEQNPSYNTHYQRKLNDLKRANILIAISDSSRKEAIDYLEFPDDLVFNCSEGSDSDFHPIQIESQIVRKLQEKFNITCPFVLYTGGADGRKNLPRLIQAYAALPAPLRVSHQLLFAGKMPESNIAEFKHLAKSAGLKPDELCFTGYITDKELIQLYNLCELYVFPSWHEGFGLPALEAMACGAVVIGANTTSLPEVIGLDAALFDPMDVTAIMAKMSQALQDNGFRATLRQHGLQQAKKFSWDNSAKLAIEAFEKTYKVKETPLKSHSQTAFLITELAKKSMISILSERDLIETAKCIDLNNKSAFPYKQVLVELTWRIEGPFDSSYSLAVLNRETAIALDELGYNVALHSTEGLGDFEPSPAFLEQNPLIKKLHNKSYEISSSSADVVSRNLYPPRVDDMQSQIKLLHHYAWEESGFPQEWVNNFNAHLSGMTCLSHHVQKIMIDNGVSIPMQVSGCGVDHWERITASTNYTIKAKQFKFLHVSSCFPRKGAACLLQAYGEKFTSSDDVTLIIKTFPNPHNEIHQWLANAMQKTPNYPDVLIIEEDLHDSELKALYQLCDVLVSPTRAEGFGLPMAEAMLSGLPVITTAWSGQLDFCNSENSWLIDFEFEYADTHFDIFLSAWAKPNIDSLAKAMVDAYSSTHELRKSKAKAGKDLLLKNFLWTDVAQRYVNAVSDILEKKSNHHPKIAWLSTWNTKCGIATYSEHLISNFPSKDVVIFAPKCDSTIVADKSNCVRNWTAGKDRNGLEQITKEISSRLLNTIVIQFNYGFYNHAELSQFINDNHTFGRNIVIMMHATVNPPKLDEENFNLEFILPALKLCSRILVHSIADLNRLKNIGLIDNVALFPHGVLNYPEQKNSVKKSKYPLIASYGFCLPHKGLEELVDAVALLKNQGSPVRLRLLNAEYPDPTSATQVKKLRAQIKKLKIENLVEFNYQYLEDSESLELLSAADLIIFAYQQTGESSSAAVRYGLATKRPVAVTPISIFNDISGAAFRLSGTDSTSIASSITDVLSLLSSDSEEAREVLNRADKWRKEFDYVAVSQRLYNISSALLQHNYLQSKGLNKC
jgi:O-antigen biosynthesis alpha-1,2-mannosyltransferase